MTPSSPNPELPEDVKGMIYDHVTHQWLLDGVPVSFDPEADIPQDILDEIERLNSGNKEMGKSFYDKASMRMLAKFILRRQDEAILTAYHNGNKIGQDTIKHIYEQNA